MIRFALIAFLFSPLYVFCQQYNIRDFGAVADGKTKTTKAIQKAIDKCYSSGGGEVVVPAGIFYTGTVFLKSNVYLHLMPGSVLQGSYDPSDYPEHNIEASRKFGTITHNGLYVEYMKALIIADHAQYTGIRGEGIIKGPGEGEAFQLGLNKDGKPKNIFMIGCTNVVLKGISVFNAAQVTVSISDCERVTIDGVYIRSLVNWNCDGLDVDGRDITISNSVIDSEDDALCFKSEYLGKFCENITVTNCIVSSLCNGIKFGTGSRTGFRNFNINNCVVKKASFNGYRHFKMTPDIVYQDTIQSVNTGIVFAIVDGGVIENINISDIVMTDVLTPIVIRVGRRFVNPEKQPSVMRQIRIQNVIARGRSIIPSIIAGLHDSFIEDVTLSNIRIVNPIGVTADSFRTFPATIPESEKSYPENRMFGTRLPASAFYIRYAKGITLKDISVTYGQKDARPAFYLDSVDGIKLINVFIGNTKLDREKEMMQQKSRGVEVINSEVSKS